ncbi:glutamate synthase (ferredoxin) [Clostridium cavendishii DSM 21758]|uniref:Glutamate synthase (Ferredoxin) n=1 Tax=Clostridium cavendishii DSM 21758 TaxID=1121302 RepID=A0A1M6UUE3_9CLOT|nr:glutamate synthase large subunit [Clostridium cavendishii]SHK72849.1 glutamate synthase (ferredoxin) [Clostridium cavendishii DSM 21758]
MKSNYTGKLGLYNPSFEHDACGIGAVTSIKGEKSYKVLKDALNILVNLEHRGGIGAEENTGDGAGVLIQIPHVFLKKELNNVNINLPEEGEYGVAMLFLSLNTEASNLSKEIFKKVLEEEGLEFLGFREVPVNTSNLGKTATSCMPYILQGFVKKPINISKGIEFERKLYVARRLMEKKAIKEEALKDSTFYIASFSSRTIVYKGMLLAAQLQDFYVDLSNEEVKTAIALVHSRYSTNTFPSWERAHPNRYMIHNGEINTVRGNVNWMYTREGTCKSPILGEDFKKTLPVVDKEGSDSAILDNTLEFLMMNGRDLPLAVMMAIPEPWSKNKTMDKLKRDFYKYHATLMEPWDGPAAIVFTDGEKVGAVLDRNGLRPARYYVTKDGYLILSSEVGVLDIPSENVEKKDRLRPGRMLLVDTIEGRLIDDDELKNKYASERPYGEWLEKNLLTLGELPEARALEINCNERERIILQKAFNYSYEDVKNNLIAMAENGEEPIAAMGIDTPIAVLSNRPQPLYSYFKQLFAQVTNPPIDAIREEIVTATETFIGSEGDLLNPKAENCRQLKLDKPIITNEEIAKIKALNMPGFRTKVIKTIYNPKGGKVSLEAALDKIFSDADEAYKEGFNIFVLSDRGVDENNAPVPALLAIAGLHHHAIRKGYRTDVAVVLESGGPRDVHHFATLLGYGASAINPYLAYESIKGLIEADMVNVEYNTAIYNFNKAIVKGIVKILSKMGISTIQSYQGAQIFEAVGLNDDVIDKYFTRTVSRIKGIGLEELAKEVEIKHTLAFDKLRHQADLSLDSEGSHKYRSGKEEHLYNPLSVHKLQEATRNGDYKIFKEYTSLLNAQDSHLTLRGLLDFKYEDEEIALEEVESVESIVKRFKTGAMSYGSISKEAHEALAIAMNRLGGRSNTGEGGEDPERFIADGNGNSRNSAIKQVASGRFGVTSEYLVNAKELQIKMAQGAKPGEGGQLPANKVYPWIAKTRHSTTGVGLISPPPHHDIYSIEDLAQLIYDLKNVNREARVSVKLVSEAGVGTVAAGVAKGGADVILISGYDGGTGASPRTSIKHAGLPWELGLAEAHQTLVMNGLRTRVKLETDGKLMTGRDVAIAALLGAEEFGFATAPLIALGCVMMRVCNLDTCPVGIATQNSELRKRFKGKPEYVENFMKFIAQELREYMSKLGFRNIDEMIGRTDKLVQKKDINGFKANKVDLTNILKNPSVPNNKAIKFEKAYDHKLNLVMDSQVLLDKCKTAIEDGDKVILNIKVTNINRTLGTILGSEITKYNKCNKLKEDTIRIKCEGSGGQSFGAFIPSGLTLELEGDSNDYIGKGLSGGKIIVYPNRKSTFVANENIIIGNVALYGATSGKAFINGVAGERFCVRNSGAYAVVEGVGDHGCEYMTGGRVVVLGNIGKNFAAGMSGGIAYVLDENEDIDKLLNKELIEIEELNDEDIEETKLLIEEHVNATNSLKGKEVLDNLQDYIPKFKKIIPTDYKRMINTIKEKEAIGLNSEEALIAAFYENIGNKR